MITENLKYRLYEEKDLPGVLNLWEDSSGWGGINVMQFQKWYLNTPYGLCILVVAVNENDEVLGQTVFIPSRVYLRGKEIKALRISAPVLHRSIRQLDIKKYDHPVFAMIRYGMQLAQEQDYGLVYAFPAFGWISLMKLFPRFGLPDIEVCSLDCFSISLEKPETYFNNENGCTVSLRNNGFDPEYEELWREAVNHFPISCGVIRNAKWLKWKLGAQLVFEIRESSTKKLKSYVAVKQDSGLLLDILGRTLEDLKESLTAVIKSIHFANPSRTAIPWKELTGMYTPMFQSLLEDIPFEFKDYKFAFGCYPLQDSIYHEQVEPSSWYMMPND